MVFVYYSHDQVPQGYYGVVAETFSRTTRIRDAERLALKDALRFARSHNYCAMLVNKTCINGTDTKNPDFDENCRARNCSIEIILYQKVPVDELAQVEF